MVGGIYITSKEASNYIFQFEVIYGPELFDVLCNNQAAV